MYVCTHYNLVQNSCNLDSCHQIYTTSVLQTLLVDAITEQTLQHCCLIQVSSLSLEGIPPPVSLSHTGQVSQWLLSQPGTCAEWRCSRGSATVQVLSLHVATVLMQLRCFDCKGLLRQLQNMMNGS